MTDEQKAVEEMAKVIIKQIPYDEKQLEINSEYAIDLSLKIATALYKQGYHEQSETVKEFAEKLLSPLIGAYNQAAARASELKHYIDHIKQTAEARLAELEGRK